MAVQAILASPRFLFRIEQTPSTLKAGQTYRISDLRSRVAPVVLHLGIDAGCGAAEGGVGRHAAHAGGVREADRSGCSPIRDRKRCRRGLRRSGCACRTSTRFVPIITSIRYWDTTLSQAMVRETELFVDSLIREDRPVTDLLTADHTFVNERLAKHYGIPNILGDEFRRVTIADVNRRGVLGQGSVLLLTSIADRTSPVLRGKWVMEVLLGSPPPPPPPNVPLLEETKAVEDGKTLSTRERMEEHRKNPSCNSCHRVIDPLGLALENFDVTGVWRIKDNGAASIRSATSMTAPSSMARSRCATRCSSTRTSSCSASPRA